METSDSHSAEKHLDWLPAVPGLLALLLYFQVVGFNYTNWDDPGFIVSNPAVQQITTENLGAVLRPGRLPGEHLYIPVFYLSLMLEGHLHGLQPSAVHLANALLHAGCAMLLAALLLRLRFSRLQTLIVAGLFAVHPLQAESVAWCIGRKDLLSAFFGLAAMLYYCQVLAAGQGGRGRLVLAMAAGLLAMLAKPTLVVLPFLLLLVDLCGRGRQPWRAYGRLVPFLIMAAAVYLVNASLAPPAVGGGVDGLVYRLAHLPAIASGWLARLFLLQPPRALYLWQEFEKNGALAHTNLLAPGLFMLAGGWCLYRRRWAAVAGLAFGVVAALPAFWQCIFSFKEFYITDRYSYLPLAGVFVFLAALPAGWPDKARKAWFWLLGVYAAAAMVLAFPAAAAWRDSDSLWQQTLRFTPDNYMAHYNLGNIHLRRGNHAEAETHYRASLAALSSPDGFFGLGTALSEQEDYPAAARALRHGLLMDPLAADMRLRLAEIHAGLGEDAEALQQLRILAAIGVPEERLAHEAAHLARQLGNAPAAAYFEQLLESVHRNQSPARNQTTTPEE